MILTTFTGWMRIWMDTGCFDCHNGPGLGGTGLRHFGIVSDYWKATGSQDIDTGRASVTNVPGDLYEFKVPGLRNVALTPPYFHDGAVDALPRVVGIMAKIPKEHSS